MASHEPTRILELIDRVARSATTADEAIPGDHVILDLDTATYYTVGVVGAFVWVRLDGQQTLAAIADQVTEEFEVERDQAAAHLLEFVTTMVARGLVTYVP